MNSIGNLAGITIIFCTYCINIAISFTATTGAISSTNAADAKLSAAKYDAVTV
jgi:hypothetical protein